MEPSPALAARTAVDALASRRRRRRLPLPRRSTAASERPDSGQTECSLAKCAADGCPVCQRVLGLRPRPVDGRTRAQFAAAPDRCHGGRPPARRHRSRHPRQTAAATSPQFAEDVCFCEEGAEAACGAGRAAPSPHPAHHTPMTLHHSGPMTSQIAMCTRPTTRPVRHQAPSSTYPDPKYSGAGPLP